MAFDCLIAEWATVPEVVQRLDAHVYSSEDLAVLHGTLTGGFGATEYTADVLDHLVSSVLRVTTESYPLPPPARHGAS